MMNSIHPRLANPLGKSVAPALIALGLTTGLLLALRAALAYTIPHNGLRIADELLTLQIAEAPLVGLPPIFLSWPAGPLRLLMPLVLLGDFIGSAAHFSIDDLLIYLGNIDREPWHALWLLRWFVMIISTAGLCSLILPLWKRTGSAIGSLSCVLLIAFVPICWQRSVMALSDGVALGFLCLAIAAAINDTGTRYQILLSGVGFGLALASKIVVLQVAPFVAIMAMERAQSKPRAMVTWSTMVLLGFSLGCPYGIAEPLRMMKSMIGNFVYKETASALVHAGILPMPIRILYNLHAMLPACFLIVIGIGAIAAVKRQQWWLLVATGAATALSGLLVLRSPAFSPGYLLPLAPVLMVFAIIALAPLLIKRLYAGILVACVVCAGLVGWREVRALDRVDAEYYAGANGAIAYVTSHPQLKRVVIPHTLATRMAGFATSRSLVSSAGAIDNAIASGSSMRQFLQDRLHLNENTADSFANHFTEYERNLSSYLRLAATPRNTSSLDIYLLGSKSDSSLSRFGALSIQEALTQLSEDRVDAVLVECHLEPTIPQSGILFGGPNAIQYRLFTRLDLDR